MSDPFLEINSVGIRYGDVVAVEDIIFSVGEGEFVTLLGPSGSGKTSLLRAIAGFVPPYKGDILLRGARLNLVPPFQRDIGMVFQDYALFPHMTVAQNISFGLEMRRVPKGERVERIAEALSLVHLEGFEQRYPVQLSGGQQQRVALARAIVIRPDLLLLDEPMSNLDALLRASMQIELLDIVARVGITTVSVTHNQEEALSMSDRVIVLANGEVQQIGSPFEVYSQPSNEFVAGFVGQSNLVRCRVIGLENGATVAKSDFEQTVTIAKTRAGVGDELLLLVRPELIEIGRSGVEHVNRFPGRISQAMFMGARLQYRVKVGERDFIVHQPAKPGSKPLAVGEPVVLGWDPAAAVELRI